LAGFLKAAFSNEATPSVPNALTNFAFWGSSEEMISPADSFSQLFF